MKIVRLALLTSGLCSAATPLFSDKNSTYYEPNPQERNILIGNLIEAYPDSFANAKNEFDKREIVSKLSKTADSITEYLCSKDLVIEISGIEVSEYDFETQSFKISMGAVEIDPKFEEKLNAALSMTREKAKKKQEKTKTPDSVYFQSQITLFDSRNFAFKVKPNSEAFSKALKNYSLNQSIKITSEIDARNIANWREEWKKSGYGSEGKNGIYFTFTLSKDVVQTMGRKFRIVNPENIVLIDGNSKMIQKFEFFNSKNTR